MKQTTIIATLLLTVLAGCASTGDVANLKDQTSVLETSVSTLNKDLAITKESVSAATIAAEKAKTAALHAERIQKSINERITATLIGL